MPYDKVHNHPECGEGEWAVVKEDDGTVMGCHETEDDANAQIAALNASEEESSRATGLFSHPARVLTLDDPEHLLAILQERHALDATVFDEHPPFFFLAEISNQRLDSYYTKMHISSLRNYADDAAAGVSFQNSHRHNEMGMGRTLQGELDESGTIPAVRATIYTVRGLNLNGVSTDHLIDGIRSGLVSDVSIGFTNPEYRCSVCGRDMLWDWDCPHIPGFQYEAPPDAEGNASGERILAFAWVHNANLAEVSSAFDGATPGAAILKAQREAEEGRLNPRQILLLEQRYRVKLPAPARQFAGVDVSGGTTKRTKERTMPESTQNGNQGRGRNGQAPDFEQSYKELQARWAVVERIIGELSEQPQGELEDQAREVAERLDQMGERVAELEAEVEQLTPLAEDGRTYREDLIAEALAEGVRAYGEDFDADTYRSLMETSALSVAKRLRDDWAAIASERFPAGRQTQQGDPAPEPPGPTDNVPDQAYAG